MFCRALQPIIPGIFDALTSVDDVNRISVAGFVARVAFGVVHHSRVEDYEGSLGNLQRNGCCQVPLNELNGLELGPLIRRIAATKSSMNAELVRPWHCPQAAIVDVAVV